MSWFQSLRDEFTLRPFEVEHTRSESAAMASGPPDVMANQEPAEVVEECSGKKKSKFQTFKKFFARKKRKEQPAAGADAGLKASQSSDNVSKTSQNNTLTRSEKDKGSGSKISLGSKALSHDSIFVSDSSEANEALGTSQDSIHGKVKSLQLQLRQAIRLGSPPSLMCVKKMDDAGAMSEDDGLPCSPPEYTTLHTVMAQRNSSISLEGIDSDSDQLSCAASSRAVSPLVVPGDFSQPASPFGCLDNSAAKHKLGLRHKAGNRRKPVARLEMKAEGDSVVEEILNSSITEAGEEREQPNTPEVVSREELKPTGNREEEEEDEEEEEEQQQPQHSRHSLLKDEEEEMEEGEDRSQAEQDVSHGPDSSSPPELRLSEEEAPDSRPRPSSMHSPRDSSLDSPGATPEPPAGPREYLLDPPGIAYGAEERGVESDLALSREEDGVQDNGEEESSFLQEVLSSLKTPLSSCSLGMEPEGVVLEIEEEEEVKEKEREDVEVDEGEEGKEEEVDKPVGYQAAGSLLSDHTAEEEEEEEVATLSTSSCRDVEEDKEEEAAEEEELVVEHVCQHDREEDGEKEEVEEVTPEERHDVQTRNAVNQAEEEGRQEEEEEEEEEESEGEEEAIELEKEPEVEEEGWEKREEEEVEEAEVRVEEAEEAIEEEREAAEEMTETFHEAADEEVAMLPQEEDEGVDVVVGDDTVSVNDEETELGDAAAHQSRAASDRSFGEEREDGEEKVEEGLEEGVEEGVEEGLEIDRAGQKSEQEEDESQRDLQQEGAEASTTQAKVSAKPPSLSLPGSLDETWSQESGAITPSKTGTTTIHINLLSPSSEKATSFFQQSPTAAHPNESVTPGHAAAATEEEEPFDDVEAVEKEEPFDDVEAVELEGEATSPASVGEEVNQPPSGSDQSKARFTITPAWQRSLSAGQAGESLTPPSSPTAVAGPGGVEAEAANSKDPEVEAEPASSAKMEQVLNPGRVRSAGAAAAPPPSSIQPPTTASTEESSVVPEGNPDSPFGVRLRKTSALHLFSSEEENTETPIEPPAQPTSCSVDSQQPISVKPSISQPVSIKPALPKKPDVHGDSGGKNKRMSDPAPVRGLSGGSNPPSWISVAKQKQKIYKENSLDDIAVRKEEQERKSSLPLYVSSAASREHSNRTAESTGKVSPLEISKHSASVEKDARRSLSPPTPVPPQPFKSQSLPYPVPPKPQLPPATAKHPPQPIPPQRSLSPPAPIPVPQKSPSCTSLPSPSKMATSSKTPQPQSTTPISPPYSSRTAPEKSGSSQTPASQRGLPPPALPQDEPPWMALAKKKAKAWSEMPQIVQ